MTRKKYNTSSFFDKYKHPKWQKRRLEIMELYAFTCGICSSKEKTLNVHHLYYVKDRDPWEYGDDELMCLCQDCHQWVHKKQDDFKDACNKVHRNILSLGDTSAFDFVTGFMEGASQLGPFRIKFNGNKEWLHAFVLGCFKQILTNNSYHSLRELIELDDGFIDYEWLRFFAVDKLFSKAEYNHILDNGYFCPKNFPAWYKNKIQAMVDDFAEQHEVA